MNFCNFVKTIITRATKDNSTINAYKENIENKDGPKYTSHLSIMQRFKNYQTFIWRYPKLEMSFKDFSLKLKRLQKYITEKKYWKNNNKDGQQNRFIEYFSLKNWEKLPEQEKKQHTLENCKICNTTHIEHSSLHLSVPANAEGLHKMCTAATESMINITSPQSSSETRGLKTVQNMINLIQPVVENKLNIKFQNPVKVSLSPLRTPQQKKKELEKNLKETRNKIEESITEPKEDVYTFLASGKSFNQYTRDRMSTSFETKKKAKKRVLTQLNKEKLGKVPKKHHGNFKNYQFDRNMYINEIKGKPEGSYINWSLLAKKYNVCIKGRVPENAGQVLKEFTKSLGIDISKFKTNSRIPSNDYTRRVRRARKVVEYKKIKIAIPAARSAKKLKDDIETKKSSGEIDIGEPIAPKTITKTKITNSGTLTEDKEIIFSRKISLDRIRMSSLQEQIELGILRYFSDYEYDCITDHELECRFHRINETKPESKEEAIHYLKSLERTRSLKIWHDHSSLLNHSHVCFTVSWIYDPANYWTNKEYEERFPHEKQMNIQSVLEKPRLYIFGRSASSDEEQAAYLKSRLEDLEGIASPIKFKDYEIYDNLRIFSGDGPARQFESGQQHGGHYPCLCGIKADQFTNLVHCFKAKVLDLDDRCTTATNSKITLEKLKNGNLNPLKNLKKDEIMDELDARHIQFSCSMKSDLLEKLTSAMQGIVRPPALMLPNPEMTSKDLKIEKYEIFCFEPLHDLANMIKNVITELPHHISDPQIQKKLLQFANTTTGEKNEIKGSDARLNLIKYVQYLEELKSEGNIEETVIQLINSLVEIVNLSYTSDEGRTPKAILRLFNQSFIFGMACRNIFGNPVKMTSRKFFGCHFHSITVHLAEAFRLFSLRSILTEEQERCFGDLRTISRNTTNRKPSNVPENAVVRFNFQQQAEHKQSHFLIQDSNIRKQGKLLKPRPRSVFSSNLLEKRPTLIQSHLERIADFMAPGIGIWWSMEDGNLVFFDGPHDRCESPEGPSLHHYRSSNLKKEAEILKSVWLNVVLKFKKTSLKLPLSRIKMYDDDGHATYVTPCEDLSDKDIPSQGHDSAASDSTDHYYCNDNVRNKAVESKETEESNLPLQIESETHDRKDDKEHEIGDITGTNSQQNAPYTGNMDTATLTQTATNEIVKRRYRDFITNLKQDTSKVDKNNDNANIAEQDLMDATEGELTQSSAQLATDTEIVNKQTELERTKVNRTALWCVQSSANGSTVPATTTIPLNRTMPCKRKLFRESNDTEEPKTKKTAIDLAVELLGDVPEVQACNKFKRLVTNYPDNKNFKDKYEIAVVKLQTAVSKYHNTIKQQLKENSKDLLLLKRKRKAELLMKFWGLYFF